MGHNLWKISRKVKKTNKKKTKKTQSNYSTAEKKAYESSSVLASVVQK